MQSDDARGVMLSSERRAVAKLIREALDRQQRSASSVAAAVGIHRSHLSKVLAAEKSLSEDKLLALADALNLPRDRILRAAGIAVTKKARVDLGAYIPIRTKGAPALKVITDPRFFDSAPFTWIFSNQPFASLGIDCELTCVDWEAVPREIAKHANAIGFYNRRARTRVGEGRARDVRHWIDLCLYRGYAVMARPNAGAPVHPTRKEANEYIEKLIAEYAARGQKPVVVYMAADTEWKLRTPFNPAFTDQYLRFVREPDPDEALRGFLEGQGNLFIGGLPQRLAATAQGCTEIISIENNPLLFSINSLVYPELMLQARNAKAILGLASSLWFETITRIREDQEFRATVCNEVPKLLDDLGVEGHHVSGSFLDRVLPRSRRLAAQEAEEPDQTHEYFPDQPTGLLDAVVRSCAQVIKEVTHDRTLEDQAIEDIIAHLGEILEPELDKTQYPMLL